MNLGGHTLDWFKMFIQVPSGTLVNALVEIRKGLIEEFKKPKAEAQYITEMKRQSNIQIKLFGILINNLRH